MAEVLDFSKAKAKQKQSAEKPKGKAKIERILTNQDVFQEVLEDVMHNWEWNAKKNKLNQLIESKLPAFAKGPDNADYLNDLNVIAFAEQKLGMLVTMCYPQVTQSNPNTWIVGFHRGTEVFTISPDLPSEANARALNILLFLTFMFRMKKLKR